MVADRPWFKRSWGVAVLAYLLVTGILGIVFLVSSRRAPLSRTPSPFDTVRTGGFTEARSVGTTVDLSAPIFSERDPAIGSERPKLVIVEYSDFQCPFCRAAFPIIREAVTSYGDRGLRLVYRDFPVDEIHPEARGAAEAAQCAHAQGKFWAYHDKLFLSQGATTPRSLGEGGLNEYSLSAAALRLYAEQIGLDRTQFDACVASRQFRQAVEEDSQAGVKLGVKGTPTWFFLPDGDPQKARRVEGVIPREALFGFLGRTLR